jgi:hypothetical protein
MRANELGKRLPSLEKHDYNEIDKLMRELARKQKISHSALEKIFARKYGHLGLDEDSDSDSRQEQIRDFIHWSCAALNLKKPYPKITISTDTDRAKTGHHTGLNVPSDNTIWIYIGNRNLVDIFRTIFHELTHTKQSQLGRIGPNDSYPGSKIEMVADAMAGIAIKIYGKNHPEIFE